MPRISTENVIIVADTEYTTFGRTRETGWPLPHHHKEIVQVAAIRLDLMTGRELARFDQLVRPVINPELSDVFRDLTGITQVQVNAVGRDFSLVLRDFLAFCASDPIWVFNADGEVFAENARLHKIEDPFLHRPFHRVKPRLAGWGYDPEVFSSGTLYKLTGASMDGHVHNALHDVRSMGAFLHFMHTRS